LANPTRLARQAAAESQTLAERLDGAVASAQSCLAAAEALYRHVESWETDWEMKRRAQSWDEVSRPNTAEFKAELAARVSSFRAAISAFDACVPYSAIEGTVELIRYLRSCSEIHVSCWPAMRAHGYRKCWGALEAAHVCAGEIEFGIGHVIQWIGAHESNGQIVWPDDGQDRERLDKLREALKYDADPRDEFRVILQDLRLEVADALGRLGEYADLPLEPWMWLEWHRGLLRAAGDGQRNASLAFDWWMGRAHRCLPADSPSRRFAVQFRVLRDEFALAASRPASECASAFWETTVKAAEAFKRATGLATEDGCMAQFKWLEWSQFERHRLSADMETMPEAWSGVVTALAEKVPGAFSRGAPLRFGRMLEREGYHAFKCRSRDDCNFEHWPRAAAESADACALVADLLEQITPDASRLAQATPNSWTMPSEPPTNKRQLPGDDAWLSPADIRRRVSSVTGNAINQRLNRWRPKHREGEGWREVPDRRPREPKYLYRWSAVQNLFISTDEGG
jgi:hypothetical protein